MTTRHGTHQDTGALLERLAAAEEMLRAIRRGEVDAVVVEGTGGDQVYTRHGADEPYRNLVEQMQEGAVVLSSRGDILYVNARFAALVGLPLESIVGSRLDRFVCPADRDDVATLLAAGSGRRRCGLLRPAAASFEVSLSLTTAKSDQGDIGNLIVTDMTELLEAHRKSDRAERDTRTKDEFLAMLAHELRTPLGTIAAAAQVLKLTHEDGDRAARAHDVIGRQVRHLSRLIEDLLDIERVVSGKMRLNRQAFDLASAVRRSVAAFVADAGLDRHIDVYTEPVWLDGDPVRIDQVIINLVANAVKYTAADGRIRVALRADGTNAVLTVEDSGAGISAALLPRIFDMYVQADQTLDRSRGGLGIGLSLVRRLVELHGGSVEASSDGEGHGSRFTVRLPAILTAEASAGPIRPPEPQVPAGRRVLLIEDSDPAREMLRMTLELAGHVVFDAADGVRGIELLGTARPHVGIIDISLPGMDGYQVAQRIREEPHGHSMLLVALTGHGAPEDAKHSLENGFDYHFVKPVDTDHLARLISQGGTGSVATPLAVA